MKGGSSIFQQGLRVHYEALTQSRASDFVTAFPGTATHKQHCHAPVQTDYNCLTMLRSHSLSHPLVSSPLTKLQRNGSSSAIQQFATDREVAGSNLPAYIALDKSLTCSVAGSYGDGSGQTLSCLSLCCPLPRSSGPAQRSRWRTV